MTDEKKIFFPFSQLLSTFENVSSLAKHVCTVQSKGSFLYML